MSVKAFASGLVYELFCSLWVSRVAAGAVLFSSAAGFACALAVVVGVTEGGKSNGAKLSYCLGCAIGSGLGTWIGRLQ